MEEYIENDSALGRLFILFEAIDDEAGWTILSFEDVSEDDGKWWCDWVNDREDEQDDGTPAAGWATFNVKKVLGVEWVCDGEAPGLIGKWWEESE